MAPINIYLIRHATPDWGRKDLPYHLPPGPPLTEQGRLEAQVLGEYLKQAGVRRLFVSPLERCLATAEIVSGIAGMPWQVEPGLIEWQPTDDRGKVLERLQPVLELALRAGQTEGPVGLVSHGGPIGVLLLSLGMDEATLITQRRFDHSNPLPPGGVWLAERNGDGQQWGLKMAFQPEKGILL